LRKQFVGPNSEGRLHFIESDARSFIRQTGQHYDVLIVDLPDPSTAQLNRYYTREFFAEAKQRLNPGGVLSLSIGTYANYVSAELGRLFGITRSTLQSSFSNVVFIPTERVTVLGSDGPLHLDIAARLRARGIRTEWVTEPMLAATLSPDRLRDIAGAARAPAPVNSDFSPSLQAATLKHWLGRFDVAPVGWLLGFAATAFGVVVLLGRIPLVVSIVGFAAAGLEVLLLLGLQITRGAVYSAAALVVTAYLLGSALGATQANRYEPAAPTRAMAAALVALGAFAFGCPPALAWLGEQPAQGLVARAAFPTAAALLGALAGGVFPWAARADFRGVAPTAARLLAADLVGASLGALLIATLLLPRFGVTYTATSVGLLCFLGAVAAAVPSLRLLYRSRP
jgi:spermidine synthase